MNYAYGVTSVEQLVALFEIRAKIADKVDAPETAKAWREAADMVRGTAFVGWEQQTDGRNTHEGRRRHIAEDR